MSAYESAFGGSNAGRDFGPNDWANAGWRRRACGVGRWTAFEVIAMVLGFAVFWPIGLAILGYKLWQRKFGGDDLQTFATAKWNEARAAMSSVQAECPLLGGHGPAPPGAAATPRRAAIARSTNGARPNWRGSKRSGASSRMRIASSRSSVGTSAKRRTARSSRRFMNERRNRPGGLTRRPEYGGPSRRARRARRDSGRRYPRSLTSDRGRQVAISGGFDNASSDFKPSGAFFLQLFEQLRIWAFL